MLLADFRPFHSEFQIDRFIVLGAGRTTWGMYQQAIRELRTRFDALKQDYLQMGRKQSELVRLHEESCFTGIFDHAKGTEIALALETMAVTSKDREREFAKFLGVARVLRTQLIQENGGRWLTDHDKARLEADFWETKLAEMAALDLLSTGRVSHGTLAAIGNLPPVNRSHLLDDILDRPGELITRWRSSTAGLPGPEDQAPPVEAVRPMIESTRMGMLPC